MATEHEGNEMNGDAWRYAPNLNDPKAAGELLQAALQALGTIRFADWGKVERDLAAAMAAVGHPAGDA